MTLPSGQVVEVDLGVWICLRNTVWFPGSSSTFLGPGVTPAAPLPVVDSEFCAQLHVGGGTERSPAQRVQLGHLQPKDDHPVSWGCSAGSSLPQGFCLKEGLQSTCLNWTGLLSNPKIAPSWVVGSAGSGWDGTACAVGQHGTAWSCKMGGSLQDLPCSVDPKAGSGTFVLPTLSFSPGSPSPGALKFSMGVWEPLSWEGPVMRWRNGM